MNRVVALLTPLVFAPVAAVVTGWLGQHFPGLGHLDPTQLVALEIAGFTGAVAAAVKWLHGWQKHEARNASSHKL